jgi:hypothetical protein
MTKESIGFRSRITHPIQCPSCSSADYRSDIAVETLVIKAVGVVTIASCAAAKCGRIYQFTLPNSRSGKPSWASRRNRALYTASLAIITSYAVVMTAVAAIR